MSTPQQRGETLWYVGQQDSWLGPYPSEEVVRRLKDGLISWVDYIWTPTGGQGWSRICELAVFQIHFPKRPSDDLLAEIREAAAKIASVGYDSANRSGISINVGTASVRPPLTHISKGRAGSEVLGSVRGHDVERRVAERRRSVWFLQFEGSEFGPLNLNEVQVILKSGKLKGALFAWCEGMETWRAVDEIPELGVVSEKVPFPKGTKREERRRTQRVALVATVRYTLPMGLGIQGGQYTGVCRDINHEGMLVLSYRIPPVFSDAIRIEVTPLGSSGIDPFVTEGHVVRVLPDQSGFSVRFKSLDVGVRETIQNYMIKHGS